MKLKLTLQLVSLIFISIVTSCTSVNKDTVERISFVEDLLGKMSIEEKVGQTAQITLDALTKGDDVFTSYEPVELDEDLLRKALLDYHLGSVLNTANNKALSTETWNRLIGGIQKCAAQST